MLHFERLDTSDSAMSTSMSDSETISMRCASAEDGHQGHRLFWAGQTPSDFDSNSSPRFPQNRLSEYDICCYFFCSLPLSKLTQTFLTSPNTGVNDLQEQLTGPWVEDENGPI